MSSGFLAAPIRSDYEQQSFGQSNSPPSLTTASSPASSDSTGEDGHGKVLKGSQNSQRPLDASSNQGPIQFVGNGSLGPGISASNGYSPSIWTGDSPGLLKGFQGQAASVHPFQQGNKVEFNSMSFGAWDTSFSSSGMSMQQDGDMSMDLDSVAGTDSGFSPLSAHSPDTIAQIQQRASHNSSNTATAVASVSSPTGSDVKTGMQAIFNGQRQSASTLGSEHNCIGSGEDSEGNAWKAKTSDNDEAMFDSLIQNGSFEPPSADASDSGSQSGPSGAQTHCSAASEPKARQPAKGASRKAAKAGSSKASSSYASRPPSNASSPQKTETDLSSTPTTAAASAGKQGCQTAVNSNNLDADLGYSAFTVVRPSREQLKNLQVHVHGVPMHGAKSRVETQIRMRLELVQPKLTRNADGSPSEPAWERIGSFTHIKLPPLSGTKRKSKKYQRTDVPPEKTLFVDATVVNATPPHDRVFVCKGCRQRERKRAHRKKDPKAPVDLQPTAEEMKSLGIDPAAPNASEKAAARMEEEEKKRVVLFNCGDFVDFEEGEAVLPTRITCYCRHHKEKVGFCVIFTMRDWQGRLVATGSTPPIMITDDHKSMGIAAQAAAVAAAMPPHAQQQLLQAVPQPQPHGVVKQVNGTSPRGAPAPVDESTSPPQGPASGATTPNGSNAYGEVTQRRKDRGKPYADSRRRRNTSGKDLSMTAYSETGQSTPANGLSPPAASDMATNEFWNAFALAGSMVGFGRSNSVGTSADAQTPGAVSSAPSASPVQAPTIQNANTMTMQQQQLPQMLQTHLEQGSLSPNTLQTNMQSLPQFDFEQFFRNTQTANPNGSEFAQLMAMAAAAAMPAPGRTGNPIPPSDAIPSLQPNGTPAPESRPLPRISKLIPGEGPTSGGIEVTVLGENFVEGVSCVFGDVAASNTKVWASNTLVCILPPSPSPGPVVVSLKCPPEAIDARGRPETGPLQLFTYVDTTDRALMELALQVVGLQMTGQMRSAREVAMRVVGSGHQPNANPPFTGSTDHHGTNHSQSRDAVCGLFTAHVGRRANSNFQDTVIDFLSILDAPLNDEDLPEGCTPRLDGIRLANKQGHSLLHLAVMMGFHRLVEFLILRGCPVNARDANGATALHFAALLGRVTITRLLLRLGARDGIADANGLLPIDLAREKDQVDVEVILADTDRTGHWQVRNVASHHDSGISISDDDLESDEDIDESDLDSGNISTDLEVESEAPFSSDADSAEESTASDSESPHHHRPDGDGEKHAPSPSKATSDEKSAWEASDRKHAANEMDEHLPALKSWLARAGDTVSGVDWVNKKLLTGPVAHRFAQLQMPAMPAIPVFHLALPAAPSMPFMPWLNRSPSESDEDDVDLKEKGKARESGSDRWEHEEHSRLLRMWRSVVEESAMWISPLYSPPPAYESVADSVAQQGMGQDQGDCAGPSRLADIDGQSSSRRVDSCARVGTFGGPETQQTGSSSSGTSTPRASRSSPGSATPIGRPRSAAGQRSSQGRTSSSINASTNVDAATATSSSLSPARRKRTLKDDAMLMWFWIPVLLLVGVVLLFSKSSSILSLADLMSYLDLPMDYYRPQAQMRAVQEGVQAAAAQIEELGRAAL